MRSAKMKSSVPQLCIVPEVLHLIRLAVVSWAQETTGEVESSGDEACLEHTLYYIEHR